MKLLLWAVILFFPLTILRADVKGCCINGSPQQVTQVTQTVGLSPTDQKSRTHVCHQCHSGDCQPALCCCSHTPQLPTVPLAREMVQVPRPLESERSPMGRESENLLKAWIKFSPQSCAQTLLNEFSMLSSSVKHPRFLLLQILRT